MKEYALFVEVNGDAQLYCGGQFALGANNLGLADNIAQIWKTLEQARERVVELREVRYNPTDRTRTFIIKTLPLSAEKVTDAKPIICDGCNVRHPFEHRCHGSRAMVMGRQTNRSCQCTDCAV